MAWRPQNDIPFGIRLLLRFKTYYELRPINHDLYNNDKLRPPSQSELTPIISNLELTNLDSFINKSLSKYLYIIVMSFTYN